MTADKSGSADSLGRFSAAGRAVPRRAVHLFAGLLVLAGIGGAGVSIADDDRTAAKPAAAEAQTDFRPPPSAAGPRVYVPVRPADPAQADKQFAIGQESAFGPQSEELIRSGHHGYERNATAAESDTSRPTSAAPTSPSAPPAPGAK